MKPISYIGLVSLLALGACSSAYRTTQTPDDVYYSPRQEQRTYAYGNGSNGNSYQDENDANYVQGTQGDGNYVTYQDDDQGDYARRLQRFGDSKYNGGYWDGYNAASNLYMSSGFYGSGLGWGYSPFYSSFYGPSPEHWHGMGLGWWFLQPLVRQLGLSVRRQLLGHGRILALFLLSILWRWWLVRSRRILRRRIL